MSLPYPWNSQVEDWGNDFEEKHGRFPTKEEIQKYMESLNE